MFFFFPPWNLPITRCIFRLSTACCKRSLIFVTKQEKILSSFILPFSELRGVAQLTQLSPIILFSWIGILTWNSWRQVNFGQGLLSRTKFEYVKKRPGSDTVQSNHWGLWIVWIPALQIEFIEKLQVNEIRRPICKTPTCWRAIRV